MTDRVLIVACSEWDNVRRTGLNELTRLPEFVHGGNWQEAISIIPTFEGHAKGCPNSYSSMAVPSYIRHVPLSVSVDFSCSSERCRIKQDLPNDRSLWETFAAEAIKHIYTFAKGRNTDLLAIDWPMGPLVDRFAGTENTQVVFTADLVPSQLGAKSLWELGIRRGDRIHLPSKSWHNRIVTESPTLRSRSTGDVRISKFGLALNRDFKLNEKQFAKAELLADINQMYGCDWKCGDLLLVCRNRWSEDDQKNHELLFEVLPNFLTWANANHWFPRVLIGPLGFPQRLNNLTNLFYGTGHGLGFRESIAFESTAVTGQRKWDFVLKGADVQLIPARYEPCGLNHAQGMAFGVVPLCSKQGCMGEDPMKDGVNSLLFDWDETDKKRSTADFAKLLKLACSTYYRDVGGWLRIRDNAKRASTEYDLSQIVNEYNSKLF